MPWRFELWLFLYRFCSRMVYCSVSIGTSCCKEEDACLVFSACGLSGLSGSVELGFRAVLQCHRFLLNMRQVLAHSSSSPPVLHYLPPLPVTACIWVGRHSVWLWQASMGVWPSNVWSDQRISFVLFQQDYGGSFSVPNVKMSFSLCF